MDVDSQLEAMLSKSADQLKMLATEKLKLEQENQTLFAQLKSIENNKEIIMEAIKETTAQVNAEMEKKFKIQNEIIKIKEDTAVLDAKNTKQKAANQKYEESMIKQIEDVKTQSTANDDERTKEIDAEKAYISSLNSKNDELQKEIENELRAIEQCQVCEVSRKN